MSVRSTDPHDRLLTIREYVQLPDDPLWRAELVRGRVVREPRPGTRHGWTVVRLAHFLMQHVEPRGSGIVLTETGIVVQESPPTVRGPDLSYVRAERLPAYPSDAYLYVAPDLVAEVLSPSDRKSAMAEKAGEYLKAGVHLVWVVDPQRRRVTVYRPDTAPLTLTGDDVLSGGDVLPGFALRLGRLFG
jgi:Uma2 family endonuclease